MDHADWFDKLVSDHTLDPFDYSTVPLLVPLYPDGQVFSLRPGRSAPLMPCGEITHASLEHMDWAPPFGPRLVDEVSWKLVSETDKTMMGQTPRWYSMFVGRLCT
jgi:hypothetical protein